MDSNAQSTAADRDLVLRAQAGDSQAVAELYTRLWRAARASAYAVVRDIPTAEDVAGEAFRMALSGLKALRDPDRFAPWLRRIVRRVARRSVKAAAARASVPLDDTAPSAMPDAAETVEKRELALLVWQAVERLPPAEREAVVLYYFEGYAGDDAARFIDIPVGTLRRRLHDGRLRLRKYLTDVRAVKGADQRKTTQLRARIDALLSEDASPEEWYAVTRHVLFRRPVRHQLLANLTAAWSSAVRVDFGQHASRLMARSRGPLLDDSGPVGEAARALRAALRDFQEWTIDTRTVFEAFPDNLFRRSEDGRMLCVNPELMPPGFSSGKPGRFLRATRGLLFEATQGAVVDLAEAFLRSGSLASFKEGLRPAGVSDVLDVYWIDARSMDLSEVEDWVNELAAKLAPGAQRQCSAQAGPRYRTALRLTFDGDARPAAIGGVLAAWPGAPEGVHAVHVRLYLEPWAQIRSGQLVTADSVPVIAVGAETPK